MFYEIKDKRVKTGVTQTRWWLTAAFSGVVIAAGCVGIIFWLVMAVRPSEPSHERRPSSAFRDYQQHKVNLKSASLPLPPPPPSSSSSSAPAPAPPPPPPPSFVEYPTAEISKTTAKRKKGRIEMVDNGGEKLTADVDADASSGPGLESESEFKSDLNSKSDSNLGQRNSKNRSTKESTNADEYSDDAVESYSADAQLRSKIAKLSSTRESTNDDGGERDQIHLKSGISPLDEKTSLSLSLPAADSQANSVKKKSEAILPSWYDPNLHNANPSKSNAVMNDLKQDTVYDLPDFSIIKPDLSAFNTKTIPAFTYLKEPLPRFEHVDTTAASDFDSSHMDDSLYYHHHHHHHHHHQQQQHQHQHQLHHHHHPDHDANLHQQPDNNLQLEQPQQQLRQPHSSISLKDNEFINAAGAALAAVLTNVNGGGKDDNTSYSLTNFLQNRLQSVHDWLLYGSKRNRTVAGTGTGNGNGNGNGHVDIMEIVKMVNNSLQAKNVGTIFSKLKDLYAGFNASDVQNMPVSNLLYPTSPSLLSNSTSLVSFGLLAIDLFLLHNVQQIVWNEESQIGEEMLKDPDVVALNALFMSPDRVQQLKQTTNSRIFTTDREKKSVVHDLLEFINGGLRAVLNLSKAYKSSVNRGVNARSTTSNGSTLDCIWTLYCRNLDKTAKLQGPYGFLAKMNSLGLRLMMGEFPVEKALERLMKEYNSGWGPLDCDKLFPRCNAEEAKEIVIQTALGRSTF